MDQRTTQTLFALLRSAICGTTLTENELNVFSPELLGDLLEISSKHDVTHLIAVGLKKNGLIPKEKNSVENYILQAVYRHEQTRYVYDELCSALERAEIPFLPLKGSVLKKYYPEAWMRTSCDIDVLVHREYLEKTVSFLSSTLNYVEKERATHDVSLLSPSGVNVEIHFDLVEEGRAKDAIAVLRSVWDKAILHENSKYWYEMSDAFFYFYHIAHMAKHFENGGCGIRPFIDLWILDRLPDADSDARNKLLSSSGLLTFAKASETLARVWLDGNAPDPLSLQMQEFLLQGGIYGSTENQVALHQKKKGGRFGFVLSRIFIPYAKLKRYYPILEKHAWLMPVMQVRRWFMLLNPDIANLAKNEMLANSKLKKAKSDKMNDFLDKVGLN